MKKSKLQKLLVELQREILDAEAKTPGSRETLESLKTQIDKSLWQLDKANPEKLDHESLWRRLSEAVESSESTHPKVTALVSDLLNVLSGFRV